MEDLASLYTANSANCFNTSKSSSAEKNRLINKYK